jgi:hypothetical protein
MNEDKLFVLTRESTPIQSPVYVGRVEIASDLYYELTSMPNRFHRFMAWLLLGWKFEIYDANKPSEKMLLNG